MCNPTSSNIPAAAAAAGASSLNKRKDSERTELDNIQQYLHTHPASDRYWESYVNRLITLQGNTSKEDPSYPKINSLVEQFFRKSSGSPAPAAAAPLPEEQRGKKSRKGMSEKLYRQTYELRILREQINSIKQNLTADPIRQQETKARGLCQLADLFDKFPAHEEVAALYKQHFPDVVVPAAAGAQSAQTLAPSRSPLAQQLSDEYDALRKANMEEEAMAYDRLDALRQLQELPNEENFPISRMDERYIAFSKTIEKIIVILEKEPLDVVAIMVELTKEREVPVLDDVRNRILSAIANSNTTISKEWLRSLLKECSYGSEEAPLDATPEQIRGLIDNEKQRHQILMDKINRTLDSAPDMSLLLHFSSNASQPRAK